MHHPRMSGGKRNSGGGGIGLNHAFGRYVHATASTFAADGGIASVEQIATTDWLGSVARVRESWMLTACFAEGDSSACEIADEFRHWS